MVVIIMLQLVLRLQKCIHFPKEVKSKKGSFFSRMLSECKRKERERKKDVWALLRFFLGGGTVSWKPFGAEAKGETLPIPQKGILAKKIRSTQKASRLAQKKNFLAWPEISFWAVMLSSSSSSPPLSAPFFDRQMTRCHVAGLGVVIGGGSDIITVFRFRGGIPFPGRKKFRY